MEPQVPFHRWEGLPATVRLQLFRIGGFKESCVICGQKGHGIHSCTRIGTPEADAMAEAWDRKWLLLMGQELIRYAMCPNDDEYRRLSAATFLKSPIDRNAVERFRIRNGIRGNGGNGGRTTSGKAIPTTGAGNKVQSSSLGQKINNGQSVAPVPSTTGTKANSRSQPKPGNSQGEDEKRKRRWRKNRKRSPKMNTNGTLAYREETEEMALDDVESELAVASNNRQRAQRRAIVPTASVREVKTSRGTAITPPPPLPAIECVNPPVAENLPLIGFRPIARVEDNVDRQSRATLRTSEDKNARSVSASALIPAGKSVRSSADVCIPTVSQRGVELIGNSSSALIVVSQSSNKRPYETWDVHKYVAATTASRKMFWERASGQKKLDIARALSFLRERDDVVQEARLEFAAEEWGLKIGRAPPVVLDEEDVI